LARCASQALGFAALSAVLFAAPNARAGLMEDLLASSAANKARARAQRGFARSGQPVRCGLVAGRATAPARREHSAIVGWAALEAAPPGCARLRAPAQAPALSTACIAADAWTLLNAQALNDKKRLATSGANFARTRTVTDGAFFAACDAQFALSMAAADATRSPARLPTAGTCAFPNNLVRRNITCRRGESCG
jgi:hypothetical protein